MRAEFKSVIIQLHGRINPKSYIRFKAHRDWLIDIMYESMESLNSSEINVDTAERQLYEAVVKIETLTD